MEEQQKPPEKRKDIYFPRLTQQETEYDPLAQEAPEGQRCVNCRFFSREYYDGDYQGHACGIVDGYPLEIVAGGYCNWWTEKPTTEPYVSTVIQPVVIVEAEAEITDDGTVALMSHDHTPDEKALFVTPRMNRIDEGGKSQPAIHKQLMVKDADGLRYMFLITSNGYKDRDEEWLPTAELEAYVNRSWVAEDVCHTGNKLLFWHDKRVAIGDIVWADMAGAFLVEVARERVNDPLTKAVWDYREAHPQEAWGTSHGFKYHRRTDGVYAGVRKFETSILPLNAAANLLTVSEVLPMPTQREEVLNKMLGIENAAELLKSKPEELTRLLTERGVEAKANQSDLGVVTTELAEYKQLVGALIGDIETLSADVASVQEKQKAAPAVPPELTTKLDAMGNRLNQVAALLELAPVPAGKGAPIPDDAPDADKAQEELGQKGNRGQNDANRFADIFSGLYER